MLQTRLEVHFLTYNKGVWERLGESVYVADEPEKVEDMAKLIRDQPLSLV